MMPNRVAIYPGSFDPPPYGHLDLIERASRLFEHLIVAVARNNEKAALFTVNERVEMLEALTKEQSKVEVTSFEGLTAEYAQTRNVHALVRGLRAISDFEYEMSMAITNQKINPNIDTVCLMPSENYLFLSSRVVRDIARYGGDLKEFVPPIVAERLQTKLLLMG